MCDRPWRQEERVQMRRGKSGEGTEKKIDRKIETKLWWMGRQSGAESSEAATTDRLSEFILHLRSVLQIESQRHPRSVGTNVDFNYQDRHAHRIPPRHACVRVNTVRTSQERHVGLCYIKQMQTNKNKKLGIRRLCKVLRCPDWHL